MPTPPDEGTIVIKGGGQNYLAGSCPPMEIVITVRHQPKKKGVKSTGRKTGGRKTGRKRSG